MVIITERNEENIKEKKLEIEERNKFINDFNEEAKRQKSKWYAKMMFNCPHIIKRTVSFLDSFLDIVEFQINYNGGYFYFVDNDYMIGEMTYKSNMIFFKYYKEFNPILENIPQKFKILDNR